MVGMEDKKEFVIGEFSFDTFHEYRDGLEDVKKIDLINQELDIHDPEVAVRLYNMIRDGEIKFKSPIGQQFFDHIADIVAEKSIDLLGDKAVIDEAEDQARKQKALGILIMGLAATAFIYFGVTQINELMTTRRLAKLQEETKKEQALKPSDGDSDVASENSDLLATDAYIDPSTLTILPEYQELYNENSDLVGWITIDDTDVSYPVMQKENDNEFYLKHDFDGKDDSNGTLFVDYRSDIVNQTTNTIIYGHNMKSGLMFGSLKSYLTEDYFNTHKTIHFDTIYEHREYEVVAVCLTQVEYQDEETFRYYNFINATTQSEWDDFYRNIQMMSVYGMDIDMDSSDKILTLSTCNSYTEDGRLFLLAKRIK